MIELTLGAATQSAETACARAEAMSWSPHCEDRVQRPGTAPRLLLICGLLSEAITWHHGKLQHVHTGTTAGVFV